MRTDSRPVRITATVTHAVLGGGEGGRAVFTLILLAVAAFVAHVRAPRPQPTAAGLERGAAATR